MDNPEKGCDAFKPIKPSKAPEKNYAFLTNHPQLVESAYNWTTKETVAQCAARSCILKCLREINPQYANFCAKVTNFCASGI